jgi:hypothetical protein
MQSIKSVILLAAALFCADAIATPPAYDGKTPMVEIGPVWFDPAMSEEEQLRVAEMLVQAQAKIIAIYGERIAPSRVVWCKTRECILFFAGTDGRSFNSPGSGKRRADAQYVFFFPALVITVQLGRPARNAFALGVLTHEMSHRELSARLRGESVPTWFNEGVASYIGGDQDQDCRPGIRGTDNLFELQTTRQWIDYTFKNRQKSRPTYCQARNEVNAWVAEHGGFAAVLELLAKRSKGKSFASLYGSQPELLARTSVPAPAPIPAPPDDSSN